MIESYQSIVSAWSNARKGGAYEKLEKKCILPAFDRDGLLAGSVWPTTAISDVSGTNPRAVT